MSEIIDLTHTFIQSMPVHPYDDPVSIKQVRNLTENKYNDWMLCSGMHVGTHIDGPGHLTDSDLLLSDVPVDTFVGKGYLVDARNEPINLSLLNDMPKEDGLIVLIMTGWGKNFGMLDYFNKHPIIPEECAKELVQRNIKMIGIDFFSPDVYPFPVHNVFLNEGIFIIENLANLEHLVGVKNFTIFALPLKTATDSALARVIAVVNGCE